MRFPLSWLKEWIDLPADIKQVSELLLKVGVELEAVETLGPSFDQVVVAKILERLPHPQADRLSVCKATDGTTTYSIVCGAPNCDAGAVVPLAKEGAVLPGDFKIKRSKIRGVESEGMLCSATELGLGEDSGGLMLLDSSLPLGSPLSAALGLGDTLLSIETTANRADQNCILGLAREISALTGMPVRWPHSPLPAALESADAGFKVEIEEPQGCSYYSARILHGVKVGPSPSWLVKRLEACGTRAVNNVVDVTNLILLELGQPLHAFDLKKIEGGRIAVRQAQKAEKLKTLDQRDFSLGESDLVIADARRPLAVAGIMGGLESGTTETSTDILLEGAVFDPLWVRRTSRRLGLSSDSSYLFERGVDPSVTAKALDRAASLMLELAGGSLGRRLEAGKPILDLKPVSLRPEKLNALLGTAYSTEEIRSLLDRRGFSVAPGASGTLLVTPPSHRREVSREADLAEEVAQLAGFQTIQSTLPPTSASPQADHPEWQNSWLCRDACLNLGLQEAFTLTYLNPQLAAAWGLEALCPKLDNPLSEEQSVLRASLLPSLAVSARHNLNRQASGVAFFEWGRVFETVAGKSPLEKDNLAILMAGKPLGRFWNQQDRAYDFYDLRGMAEALGRALKLRSRFQPASPALPAPAWLHPGQAAQVQMGPLKGWLGALHPSVLKQMALSGPVLAMELSGFPAQYILKEPRYQPYSNLPVMERDLSCLIPTDMQAGTLLEFFAKDPALARARFKVLDLYQGPNLPQGMKSLTFSFTYSSEEKSLTDKEVNTLHEEMSGRLEKALAVTVRKD